MGVVTVDRDDHALMIGFNRPEAYNLWNREVIAAVSMAYRQLGDDPSFRVGVVYGHGERFTAGLDLPSVAPLVASGDVAAILPADGYDRWNFFAEPCPKPVVVAAHGRCNTLGVELLLASEVPIAATGTKFAQLEVARDLSPGWSDVSTAHAAWPCRDATDFGTGRGTFRTGSGLYDDPNHSTCGQSAGFPWRSYLLGS